MTFTSIAKSWKACGNDQRRECIAFAVFTKLGNLGVKAKAYVSSARISLTSKINSIKDLDLKSLTLQEKILIGFAQRISDMSDSVDELEKIYPAVEKFMNNVGIEPLSAKITFSLIKDKQLSKLIGAIDKFKWSGSGTKTPYGKTEDVIGVSDFLLDSLMTPCGADGLLSSWLASGDTNWKRAADLQIDQRKEEIKKLQRTNPKDGKIAILEREIKTLEQEWKL